MSTANSPEKTDPKPSSTIVINPTQSVKINLNFLLKTSILLYFFPHQFPGLSYPLVNSEKWIYSIIPSDSKIVKKIDYP